METPEFAIQLEWEGRDSTASQCHAKTLEPIVILCSLPYAAEDRGSRNPHDVSASEFDVLAVHLLQSRGGRKVQAGPALFGW